MYFRMPKYIDGFRIMKSRNYIALCLLTLAITRCRVFSRDRFENGWFWCLKTEAFGDLLCCLWFIYQHNIFVMSISSTPRNIVVPIVFSHQLITSMLQIQHTGVLTFSGTESITKPFKKNAERTVIFDPFILMIFFSFWCFINIFWMAFKNTLFNHFGF